MYPGADFYGIRKIFLSYANLPTFLPLPVAVQHGWQIHATAFEASASPPEIWVWSQRTASELERFYPARKIRVVGSVFCYLESISIKKLPQSDRCGSICIPPHSSHFTSTDYSIEDFASALNALDDELKPITVMLYYLDVNEYTVATYEKFGFNVVSNGSLFNDDFLSNFLINVSNKKNCIFSDFGSGVLFSANLGLNLIRVNIKSQLINHGNEYVEAGVMADLNSFCDNFMVSSHKDIVNSELGVSSLLSPSEIRRVIIRNYFTFNFLARSFRWVVSSFLRKIGLLKKTVSLK
jgi:hypothetical protein